MIAPLTLAAVPVAAAVYGLTYATVAPSCRFWGDLMARGQGQSNHVALTFDDGPTPQFTAPVLDALRDSGVQAAFFVVGENVEKHPDLLRRIHAEGHLIGNHSYHHSHFTVFRRWPYWEREIRRTDDAIFAAVGVRPRLFRPPMGVKTWHTSIARRRTGHTTVTWSRRAVDGLPTTAERIARRFAGVSGGDVLLLHDGVEPHALHSNRAATIEAIPHLIESLRARSLSLARLDQLLGLQAYESAELDVAPRKRRG